MKFTLSWLKEHLETQASVEEILKTLTMIGLEVESVKNPGETLKEFRIVEITAAQKHPNADRRKVLTVNTGSEFLTVVCGDPKADAGIKGVLARPGMYVPGLDVTLKQSKIRDVESHGMMCSLMELGLAENSDGIIQLSADAPVGEAYVAYQGLDDPQIEIAITPNRGDCLGVRGIARDLAAAGLGTLKPFEIKPVLGTIKNPYAIARLFESEKPCPLFVGRFIKGVRNGASPDWLKRRLESVGVRSISALVDVTNLLAYELGRPMHVFDAAAIQGDFHVRFARSGEKLLALDENTYILDESMIVVADEARPLSIAGIMGGKDSGCQDGTTSVFLESALFDPFLIAQTGRQLAIISDSRYRFERGVDAALVIPAVERATQLILELCGGEPSELSISGSVPQNERIIELNLDRVQAMSGVSIPSAKSLETLRDLGFEVTEKGKALSVRAPSWRHDIEQDIDLVEEIVRINGYDQIPLEPFSTTTYFHESHGYEGKVREQRDWLARTVLSERGLVEAVTWSFLSESMAQAFGWSDADLRLENPISSELSIMRPSLLPNLIETIARNIDRGQERVHLFEVGAEYKNAVPEGQIQTVAGVRSQTMDEKHWDGAPKTPDIWDVKADAFAILQACGVQMDSIQISEEVPSYYHPGRAGSIRLGAKTVLGYFGDLHPGLLKSFGLKKGVCLFEVFLSTIPVSHKPKKNKPFHVSPYPAVDRDFAFVVEKEVPADVVLRAAQKAAPELIETVRLFDVYEGKDLGADKKSLAISIRLRPYDKTLTDQEIQAVSDAVIQKVNTTTGGILRA